MSGKSLIPLVVGLGVGGFALKMVVDTVKKARGAQPKISEIWAPVDEIPVGRKINEAMIKTIPFPASLVPDGSFAEKSELVGRVTRINAPAGLPVIEAMLHPPGTPAGLHVPIGYRAISIKIDESSGVSNMLNPGSRVDIIGSFQVRRGNRQETISKILIENVEVGAVGQKIGPESGVDQKGPKLGKPARAVTLFVRPTDTAIIHLAEQRGKLKLSMRGDTDFKTGASGKTIMQSDVLGHLLDGTKENKPGFLDQLKNFFGGDKDKAPPAPVIAKVLPKPSGPPKWEHIMTIYNGDNMRRMGWQKLDSPNSVEIHSGTRPAQETPTTGPTDALLQRAASLLKSSDSVKRRPDFDDQPTSEPARRPGYRQLNLNER